MKKILLELALVAWVLALALLMAAPAHPFELPAPDAALVAQTLTGSSHTVQAASWELGAPDLIDGRRVWLDVFGLENLTGLDFSDVGGGVSTDVTPDNALCGGAGWVPDEWMVYGGYHVGW